VMEKNILVPLGPHNKGIRGVHHALALAKRIPARVFILEWVPSEGEDDQRSPEEDVLGDLITTARQAGLNVSHHKARGPFEKELVGFVHEEGIHVLVLEEGEEHWNRVLQQTRATLPTQVILVKQKRGRNSPRRRKKR
jgi:hypothetical protein